MSLHRICAAVAIAVGVMPVPARATGDLIFRSGFERGFTIETPEITAAPGDAYTWCYFVRTPNAGATGIRRWSSTMRPGMHHLIVYGTYDAGWQPLETHPSGTLSQGSCFGTGTGRMYAAHDAVSALALPDDGGGMPLAFDLQPGQPIAIEMYVPNAAGAPLTTSAVLQADILPDGAPFTKTASYQTVNIAISIPPNSNVTLTKTCAVPSNVKFWWLSTRTHHFATLSTISDGATMLVASSDWEHPAVAMPASPGYAFSASGLTYACSYANTTPSTVSFGESEMTDELCVGVGFFFPAAHPAICLNDTGPF